MATLPPPLILEPEKEEPTEQSKQIFDFLNDYLQPSSTLSLTEATEKLDRCSPLHHPGCDEQWSFWFMWRYIIQIAAQVPYRHPSQDKLATLISALKNLPSHTVGEFWGAELRVWQDLPFLGPNIRECLDIFDPEIDPELWKGYNAFMARLFRDRTYDVPLIALWMLRGVLEGKDLPTDKAPDPDTQLPIAAEWVFVAGPVLYEFCRNADEQRPISNDIATDVQEGPDSDEPERLSLKRWQLWKERFAHIHAHEPVKEETKILAKEAAEAMENIERGVESDTKK
ncbi:hypothetical protein HYDPIDRAFT_23299 [Hydnomerulius pinastri MD-312]|nr:hypothetical protein HYDPIDRAFT_23299 [Hydnomerulius pinastri MD-312]